MGYLTSLWRISSGRLQRVDQEVVNKVQSHIVDECLSTRLRIFVKELMTMNALSALHPSLRPPQNVKGMTTLTRSSFNKTVKVPGIKLPKKQISLTQKSWKPLLLKLRGIKPIANLGDKDPLKDTHNLILFDPEKLYDINKYAGLLDKLQKLGFSLDTMEKFEVEIGYDNWSMSEIMRAVLPQDADNVSSFTQIGHIAHLNLREENMLFKYLIGTVIIDKIPSVKTVVNKLNSIDNTYRNFEMELLAGESNFLTQTREHSCVFELDFSKVYWNSRLSTEHQRIVDIILKGSTVYDIFAGVGPFTVPLAKKRNCTIFANDLNPYSFKSLEKNIELNKLSTESVKAFNMDGRDFIRNIVKPDLVKKIQASHKHFENVTTEKTQLLSTFAIMNLPALAVDFLDTFFSLLSDLPLKFQNPEIIDPILPEVYCYAFCSKSDDMEGEVKRRAEGVIKQTLPSNAAVRIVRNVSPNKEMVCLSFKLWSELVLAVDSSENTNEQECGEPPCKLLKQSSNFSD